MLNASSIVAWSVSSTPSEATSFASGGELRSGRKMPSSAATATAQTKTSAMISAGALRDREAELAGVQRPERVAGEHRVAAERRG